MFGKEEGGGEETHVHVNFSGEERAGWWMDEEDSL